MAVSASLFGKYPDGRDITLYTISNGRGMEAAVTDLGAILVRLLVPGSDGKGTDVVLGYDRGEDYLENGCFFGAVIGPSANRIAGAAFELDGAAYRLDINDGPNNLHSHREKGYHKRLWKACPGENSVTFSLEDEDGSMGFPGNKKVSVEYALDEENALTLTYHGISDKRTILNLTNHTYFNLDGHDSGRIEEHEHGANHGDGHGGRHGGGTEPEKEDEAGDGAGSGNETEDGTGSGNETGDGAGTGNEAGAGMTDENSQSTGQAGEAPGESPALQPTEQDTEQPAGQDTDRHREEGHGHRSGHGR